MTAIGPLAPGCAFNKTEPLDLAPPVTEVGKKLSETTWNGFNVNVAVCLMPL